MRTYADACPIARALDVVGERWALLVVRELLFGPQRYSDLQRALPRASTNILRDRLRELEAHAIVQRDRLPPPASAAVYRLTERGRALAPVLEAVGVWGAQLPRPEGSALTASAVLLYLRGCLRLHDAPPAATFRVQLGATVWTVAAAEGEVTQGAPPTPDAAIRTDPETLNDLLADPLGLPRAIRAGTVETDGDVELVRALLAVPRNADRPARS